MPWEGPYCFCYDVSEHIVYPAPQPRGTQKYDLVLTGMLHSCHPAAVVEVMQKHAELLWQYKQMVRWLVGHAVSKPANIHLRDSIRGMVQDLKQLERPLFPRQWTVEEWVVLYEGDVVEDILREGAKEWVQRQLDEVPSNVILEESALESFAESILTQHDPAFRGSRSFFDPYF